MTNPFDTPLTKLATPQPAVNPFDALSATPLRTSTTSNPFDVPSAAPSARPLAVPLSTAKQVPEVPAGYDATPWGIFTNTLKAMSSGEAALPAVHFIKDLAQGTARFPVELVQSMQQALGGVVDWTAGKKDTFQNLAPVPVEGFAWLLGDENLQGMAPKVADLEQSIRGSSWAKQHGFDKVALPLAFGTVVGGEGLNFLGAGGEESAFVKAVDHLVAMNDEKKVLEFLLHNGIDQSIAEDVAPHLAGTIDRTEVENTLKSVEALQHVIDKKNAAEGVAPALPEHVSVEEGAPSALQEQHGNPDLSPENKVVEAGAFQQIEDSGMQKMVADYRAENDNVINTDNARELYGAYRENRSLSAAVHEPSSLVKNAVYDDMLKTEKGTKNNTVLFSAGVSGAGKSFGLKAIGDSLAKYPIVVDSNLNKLPGAIKNIDKALAGGYRVRIRLTYNDIEKALENALGRASRMAAEKGTGRTVPVGEVANTFLGAHDTFPGLLNHYMGNPNVEFQLFDNSGTKKLIVENAADMLDFLHEKEYNGVYEDLVSQLEKRVRAAAAEGRINGQVAKGFLERTGVSRGGGADGAGNGKGGAGARVAVGDGTQAPRPARAKKTINDTVPMPDSVGTIIARNGRAIPVERTAAHALTDIAQGKDASSWQSLVKGYMYNWTPNKKAHWFDGLSTPEFVLEKVGLGKGAEMLQDAKDKAATTLKKEFETVTGFIGRVKNQAKDGQVHTHSDTSTLIFDWLDGHEKEVTKHMTDEEIAVAREIRVYLKEWAGRLNLPEENQIGKYITHIFERGVEGKESIFAQDPELASIMAENVAKSVYDPFLQKRLGKQDYIHDVWRALDAYIKRASRKEAMDPALKELADMAEKLDDRTYAYVKDLSHKVNMRPTETEQGFDSFITQTPIGHYFTDRPTAFLSKKIRQTFYRGTLGLNLGSGLRNLTQGSNTYAKLGEKYTIIGYSKLFSRMATRNLEELYTNNVLNDSFVQDRTRGAIKKTFDMVDSTLFSHYTLSELINRGAAYYGAKSQGLAKGLSEEMAVKYAKRIVRETQFSFGAVDTPVWLNDDIKKTLFQLQNYNVKQAEFLGRMAKQKDIAGLVRYTSASFAMLYTIGKLFGMTANQIIPTIGVGGAPITSTALALGGLMSSDPQTHAKAVSQLQRNFFTLIPGGAQIRKTLQGAAALERGGSFTKQGHFRYRVGPENATQALLFGPSATANAQKYYAGLNGKKTSGANPF